MRKQYFSFIFLYIFSSCLYSQTMDDNIIINCCEDSYVFKEGPGNNPIVQNTRKTEYEASRMGATVQPHMFYGEFISLDEAKAKGVLAPKAIHRHATPENVFFDDTRICYFNLSLSRQGKRRPYSSAVPSMTCATLHVSTFRRNTSSARNVSPSPFLPHCPVSGWWRRTSVPVSGVKRA